MSTEISIDTNARHHEYVLILRARVSVSQYDTRETGADVDRYSIRAAALDTTTPPLAIPASNTQIVIPLGTSDRTRVETLCNRLAESGLMQRAFQTRTDPGKTNAIVVDGIAVADIHQLVDAATAIVPAARKTGRPAIGPEVKTRLTQDEVHELDELAFTLGIDRSELIRRHIRAGLAKRKEMKTKVRYVSINGVGGVAFDEAHPVSEDANTVTIRVLVAGADEYVTAGDWEIKRARLVAGPPDLPGDDAPVISWTDDRYLCGHNHGRVVQVAPQWLSAFYVDQRSTLAYVEPAAACEAPNWHLVEPHEAAEAPCAAKCVTQRRQRVASDLAFMRRVGRPAIAASDA